MSLDISVCDSSSYEMWVREDLPSVGRVQRLARHVAASSIIVLVTQSVAAD